MESSIARLLSWLWSLRICFFFKKNLIFGRDRDDGCDEHNDYDESDFYIDEFFLLLLSFIFSKD